MTSPLGQYAAVVAAITAVGVVGAWIVASFLKGLGLFVDDASIAGLENMALIAIGAVFGSAVVANGYKQPLHALGARVDKQQTQITTLGAVAAEVNPSAAPVIAEVLAPGTVQPSPVEPKPIEPNENENEL